MAQGRPQFIGASGQYYVAYSLAVRQINASLTVGNAPSVDILAAAPDGSRTLAIQVKTSRNAHRSIRYGRKDTREWDVGVSALGKHSEAFWYAFVDLQEEHETWKPLVFFVPSRWIAEFMKPTFTRFMYLLPVTAEALTRERWDLVHGYLKGDSEAVRWAKEWPEEAHWS